MLNRRDFEQILDRGIDLSEVVKQIHNFETGFPFAHLDRPAIRGDGLFSFSEGEVSRYERLFLEKAPGQRVLKFVPASGAASRMFKHLFEFLEEWERYVTREIPPEGDLDFNCVEYLLRHIRLIGFYPALVDVMKKNGMDLDEVIADKDYDKVVRFILEEPGLNYASLPKGLLLFHSYPGGPRTAAEEHLVEAAHYATDASGNARIHFTISPEHRDRFEEHFRKVQGVLEKAFKVRFDISMSVQKPQTDTLAVDEHNEPVRNADGSLMFRPGGHGALISNLNEQDADIVFIKNIDNIVPDRLKPDTYLYKRVIGGYLLEMQEVVNRFLQQAEYEMLPEAELRGMAVYAKEKLCIPIPGEFDRMIPAEKQSYLFGRLNRPMRVCGMVRNQGEPGGGPFWVRDSEGITSLQIIESSQVDHRNHDQVTVLRSSTHFNPVDLVCSIRDYRGKHFDLSHYVDESTGFISKKSTGGKTIKAQELPGLWNGAMAKWITVFVETPIITFNPVKTVNDLLRKEHLG